MVSKGELLGDAEIKQYAAQRASVAVPSGQRLPGTVRVTDSNQIEYACSQSEQATQVPKELAYVRLYGQQPLLGIVRYDVIDFFVDQYFEPDRKSKADDVFRLSVELTILAQLADYFSLDIMHDIEAIQGDHSFVMGICIPAQVFVEALSYSEQVKLLVCDNSILRQLASAIVTKFSNTLDEVQRPLLVL